MGLGVGLMEELGKLPWWDIASTGKHVVQAWMFVRPDTVVPPISKCGLILEEGGPGSARPNLAHWQVQEPGWSEGHTVLGCQTYWFA